MAVTRPESVTAGGGNYRPRSSRRAHMSRPTLATRPQAAETSGDPAKRSHTPHSGAVMFYKPSKKTAVRVDFLEGFESAGWVETRGGSFGQSCRPGPGPSRMLFSEGHFTLGLSKKYLNIPRHAQEHQKHYNDYINQMYRYWASKIHLLVN